MLKRIRTTLLLILFIVSVTNISLAHHIVDADGDDGVTWWGNHWANASAKAPESADGYYSIWAYIEGVDGTLDYDGGSYSGVLNDSVSASFWPLEGQATPVHSAYINTDGDEDWSPK